MNRIVGSVVIYNPNIKDINALAKSFLGNRKNRKLVIVDNSPRKNEELLSQLRVWGDIEYIKSDNVGFGRGHNIAIKRFLNESDFYFILNPDIYFHPNVIDGLVEEMQKNPTVGLSSGGIYFPDEKIQRVHRLLPSLFDLFLRRFAPLFLKKIFSEKMQQNELTHLKLDQPYLAPYISGCFMAFRSSVLQELKGFDPQYFMYMEDLDLSRRAFGLADNTVFPTLKIYHKWQRASYKSKRFLWINLKSNFIYFRKWGFFRDRERNVLNRRARNL